MKAGDSEVTVKEQESDIQSELIEFFSRRIFLDWILSNRLLIKSNH